ncbi:MAG: 2OG-Fe(II) oxygenase family protein [Pseudomonadota bacterium]
MNDIVPVIDFASYAPGDTANLKRIADAVDTALSSVGFMAIRNIGLEPGILDTVFGQSRTFFGGDAGTKQASAYRSAAENFGYQGMAEENLDPTAPADLKETFTMRDVLNKPPEDGRWPSPKFQSLMTMFYRDCFDAALRLMSVLDVALDNEPGFFERYHTGENTTLRLLHYPAVRTAAVAPGQLGAGAHTDYGLLTLLFQSGVGGLEVQAADGQWHAVSADPDAVVINAGDLLEIWTNGRYRSTPHRVQPKVGNVQRQSIAMFVDPDSATEVRALASCTGPDNPPRFAPTSAGAHLQERIEASHKARFAR